MNQCPGIEKGPDPDPRSCREIRPIRRRPTPERKAASPEGQGEETAHKKQYDLPLIAILRGRMRKWETETSRATELPPKRLLNCVSTTSSRAPRLMEPARGVPPITAALPTAAGQWRHPFLGRGRRGCSPLAVGCALGLVRTPGLAALGPACSARAFVSGVGLALCARVSAVLRGAGPGREL